MATGAVKVVIARPVHARLRSIVEAESEQAGRQITLSELLEKMISTYEQARKEA